jgi:hypothetical protein
MVVLLDVGRDLLEHGQRPIPLWPLRFASPKRAALRCCLILGLGLKPPRNVGHPLFIASIFFHRLWLYALALFLIGWVFQFIGHAFEFKPPEFFHDWRFLFVGVRWRWVKIHGKA